MDNLDKLIRSLQKQHGEGVVMDLRKGLDSLPNITRIPVDSPKIGDALGMGGVPKGRILEIFGPESGGKCIAYETNVTINVEDNFYKFLVKGGFINEEKRIS